MKVLQTSNIYLGKYFNDNCAAGNKLRAGIKSIFSGIIDTAKNDKVDIVILAGNIFDNLDLSQNLFDFFVSEVGRLENIPVILFPGDHDPYEVGSFWDHWKIAPPSANLYILAGKKPVKHDIPNLSLTIYGVYVASGQSGGRPLEYLKKNGASNYHIAVTNTANIKNNRSNEDPVDLRPFASFGFNYVALGGADEYREYDKSGIKAGSAGSPLGLSPEKTDSGGILMVEIEDGSIKTEFRKIQGFEWRTAEISMESVHSLDDLKNRILEFSGQNTLLRVRLSGLTLLEARLNIGHLKSELEEHFLDLEFEDETRVLPENISEVKVHEKTVLGQYLKVMVGRLNEAPEAEREKYEKSLKIGYSLLSGREVW